MKTTWFAALTRQEDSTAQAICYAAQEMGMEAHLCTHRPFSPLEHEAFPPEGPCLFYGGINAAIETLKTPNCPKPFVWFDPVRLSCSTYMPMWEKFILSRKRELFRLGELLGSRDYLFRRFGRDNRIFIRPDTNDKSFAGQVVTREEFDDLFEWDFVEENMPDILVVVSEPVDILAEWRLFVCEGKVVAASMYKEGGMLHLERGCPREAKMLAKQAALSWSPHPFFVLDVCKTLVGYRIIECGSANCAGFYLADVKTIVREMSRVAEKES